VSDGSLNLEEKADLIFSVDVYHHIQDRTVYFSKMAQYLKQDGALVVIDRTEEKVKQSCRAYPLASRHEAKALRNPVVVLVENRESYFCSTIHPHMHYVSTVK
jgi:cyclopropane fatty-acyl-phospholipid synthase-like methyltransferase